MINSSKILPYDSVMFENGTLLICHTWHLQYTFFKYFYGEQKTTEVNRADQPVKPKIWFYCDITDTKPSLMCTVQMLSLM